MDNRSTEERALRATGPHGPAGGLVRDEARVTEEGVERSGPGMIDSRLPRVNQAVLAAVLLASFVADFFWTVPVWAAFLLGGVIAGPKGNPVQAVFAYLVKPRIGPPRSLEDPRPPRFAATLGFIFLAASSLLHFLAEWDSVAWGLALTVAALASIAAVFNICVGCELYVLIMRARGGFRNPWRIETAAAVAAQTGAKPSPAGD